MATRTVTTKFFEFNQNNSGGSFDISDKKGIGPSVWIEALNASDACARAEQIGLYFNGCDNGRDCECCGDRWSTPYGDGADNAPKANDSDRWHDTTYVHLLDGTIQRIKSK